jgi:hypothetical protein
MSSFESRLERLELKYRVNESQVAQIRRDIALYCHPDAHNPQGQDHAGYEVLSLYLDSPGLAFFEAKERGDAERLKLRIRGYTGSSRATLECKRRIVDVIDKTRAAVDLKDIERAARGEVDPGPDQPDARGFLDEFATIRACTGAEPTLLMRYEREAHVSDIDPYARVTMDRNIQAARVQDWDLDGPSEGWCRFDDHWRRDEDLRPVILELKCHLSIPWWMTDLIQRHRLKRESFSKYCIGIYLSERAMGRDVVARRSARWMQ